MTTKTCQGSCHCGNVRFEAELDLAAGTGKCNCSICSKTRNWSASVQPDAFRLLSDAGQVTDYQFGTDSVHWPFCKTCGVRPYSHGDIAEMGGKFFSANVACLDGVAPEDLAAAPVRHCNGRDNDWGNEPSDAEKHYL